MTVKSNGSEFKRFYTDPIIWGKDAWHDDEIVMVNGVEWNFDQEIELVPDHAIVQVVSGVFYAAASDTDGADLSAVFRRWLKTQASVILVIDVPKEKKESMIAAVRAAGGDIVKSKK